MKKDSLGLTIAYMAVFTALVVALAFVAIPIGGAGVPIVLQNAAIILAGLVLGGKRGLYVGLLFLLLGLAFPVLAGGGTTLRALAGPTAGYIVGYVISAALAGTIAYRAPRSSKAGLIVTLAIAAVVGLFTQYFCGALGLMVRAGMDASTAAVTQLPFILPDCGKLVFAVAIASAVHAAFPDLMGRTSRA